MEDPVRVARDRDEAKARDSYTSSSEYWNNSNAEYPDVYTSRRVYIHRDIRTIARNKTFFAMFAAPSFFFPPSTATKKARRRLKRLRGIPHLLSGIKPARNRCLQFRSAPRFRAIPAFSSSFLFAFSPFFLFPRANRFVARVQSLYPSWNTNYGGLDGGETRRGKELVRSDLDEFIPSAGIEKSLASRAKLSNSPPFTFRRLFLSRLSRPSEKLGASGASVRAISLKDVDR